MWSFMLPVVKDGRYLARWLRTKIDSQLARGDFDGALQSIGDGYSLARFMGNGETIVQQLVALAMQELMRDAVQSAISKPHCPNLYWALASVPRDTTRIQRAIEFELGGVESVFGALADVEAASGDEHYWQVRLQELLASINQLTSDNRDLSFSIVLTAMTGGPVAKQKLIEAGWKAADVERMSPNQALLINTRRELQYWSNQLSKGSLLPYALASRLNQQAMGDFQHWIEQNRYSSLAAGIASVVFPAVEMVRKAEARAQFQHNRLMVVEALRMHAAKHNGQLPKSLDALDPVPAPENPFNNRPFDYTVRATPGGLTIELLGALPEPYQSFERLGISFKGATVAP
jgi:hypothetical protein